jgi:hypothetical protein
LTTLGISLASINQKHVKQCFLAQLHPKKIASVFAKQETLCEEGKKSIHVRSTENYKQTMVAQIHIMDNWQANGHLYCILSSWETLPVH